MRTRKKNIEDIKEEDKCPECGGFGWASQEVPEGSLAIDCPACGGIGEKKTKISRQEQGVKRK